MFLAKEGSYSCKLDTVAMARACKLQDMPWGYVPFTKPLRQTLALITKTWHLKPVAHLQGNLINTAPHTLPWQTLALTTKNWHLKPVAHLQGNLTRVSASLIVNADIMLVTCPMCLAVMSTSLSVFALDHQSCHGAKQQLKSRCRLAICIWLDKQHGDPLLTCKNRANC